MKTWFCVIIIFELTLFGKKHTLPCSNIVHTEAALGAFATKEYQKGEIIGDYTGALYLAKEGMQLL